MFEPISGLFKGKREVGEGDVHHLVQQFLRRELKGESAYCEPISGGILSIRVTTPATAQEVRLLEYDIKRFVKQEVGVPVKRVVVI